MKKCVEPVRICFVAMAITILFSIVSLFVLWNSERQIYPPQKTEKLPMTGSYVLSNSNISHPIPEDGQLNIEKDFYKITFLGHFEREVPENQLISFRLDNMYMRLYVNDKLLWSLGKPYSILPYVKSSGNGWKYLPSPGIKSTDTVRIELENLYTNHVQDTYAAFFEGLSTQNPAMRISYDLRTLLLPSFLALFVLFMGICEFCYALSRLFAKQDSFEYFSLSGLSIFSSIWFLINFNVLELFIPYPIVNNAIQCLSLSLIMCCAALYIASLLTGKRKIVAQLLAAASIVFTTITVILQHSGVLDYYDTIPVNYAFLAVLFITALLMLALEYKVKPTVETKQKIFPIFLLFFAGLLDVFFSYIGIFSFVIFQFSFFLFNIWQFYQVWLTTNKMARQQAEISLLQEDHERQNRLLEYQLLLSKSTNGLYESIYEFDVTHNCAASDATRKYFTTLGLSPDALYDESIYVVAENKIHKPFRQGYKDIFCTQNILKQYEAGIETLSYDFMIANDNDNYNDNYYWIRLDARIFFWNADQSVRMITYNQNIDAEKRQELFLRNRAELDALTGLFNRKAFEQQAHDILKNKSKEETVCCLIVDIDDFKDINDTYGHMAGDFALIELSSMLKTVFHTPDIVGRLGGDEFIIFVNNIDEGSALDKASTFLQTLTHSPLQFEDKKLWLKASIGIAAFSEYSDSFDTLYKHADEALYLSKRGGKNRFILYEKNDI